VSRPDRWEALGLTKPESWGKPGSTDPIDLLMFAATGGAASVDDPILAMLDAIEDELGTLASALGDDMAVHGYAGAARVLAHRVKAVRLLLARCDDKRGDR
jgi:hypothetical protein